MRDKGLSFKKGSHTNVGKTSPLIDLKINTNMNLLRTVFLFRQVIYHFLQRASFEARGDGKGDVLLIVTFQENDNL